jgi:hypothetical protein
MISQTSHRQQDPRLCHLHRYLGRQCAAKKLLLHWQHVVKKRRWTTTFHTREKNKTKMSLEKAEEPDPFPLPFFFFFFFFFSCESPRSSPTVSSSLSGKAKGETLRRPGEYQPYYYFARGSHCAVQQICVFYFSKQQTVQECNGMKPSWCFRLFLMDWLSEVSSSFFS